MARCSVRNVTSRFELSPGRRKAIGTLNGRDVVTGEIIVGNDEFAPAEALLNYITRAPSGDGLLLVEIPFAVEARAAQPVRSYSMRLRAMPLLDIASPVSTGRWRYETTRSAFASRVRSGCRGDYWGHFSPLAA